MAYESTLAIRNNVAITQAAWTDIGGRAVGAYALPISCNCVVVYNSGSFPVTLATNPADANSTVNIPAGASWSLGTPSWGPRLGGPTTGCRYRFGSPEAVCSLQSGSGNQSMTVEFIV